MKRKISDTRGYAYYASDKSPLRRLNRSYQRRRRPRFNKSYDSNHCGSNVTHSARARQRHRNRRLWARYRRRSRSSSRTPQPSIRSQIHQDERPKAEYVKEEDITQCQYLYYGHYIGNETRSLEFKRGRGRYMQRFFPRDVCVYGSAFLNSSGGSLLVGVCDDGRVNGVPFSHEFEDDTRLQVDSIVKQFIPPLLPQNYSLQFLPVLKPRRKRHDLKVLCLTFIVPPTFSDPTLVQVNGGNIYVRRDGSVEGPLRSPAVLEWARQVWIKKLQSLQYCMNAYMSERWTYMRQITWLQNYIDGLHHVITSLQPETPAAPPAEQEERTEPDLNSFKFQHFLTPMGCPVDGATHRTGDLDRNQRCKSV